MIPTRHPLSLLVSSNVGLFLAAQLVVSPAQAHAAAPPAFRVIVHPRQPAATMSRKLLTDILFKRVVRWPDGTPVKLVDLPPSSPVRAELATSLDRSVAAIRSYWQQKLFSGQDIPPPELSSEAAVVRFVLEHPGAIGYVGPTTDLRGARVLVIE